MIKLTQAPLNVDCIIQGVEEKGIGLKLMEMGLVPGVKIKRTVDAPAGDPIAILVDDSFLLGIRKSEADLVTVYFST